MVAKAGKLSDNFHLSDGLGMKYYLRCRMSWGSSSARGHQVYLEKKHPDGLRVRCILKAKRIWGASKDAVVR